MSRVMVAVDASVGVSAEGFAQAWGEVPEALEAGPAKVEPIPEGAFLPGLAELVMVPLAVNLSAAVVYDLVRRVLRRASRQREICEVEVAEFTSTGGDRVVVVRARREIR